MSTDQADELADFVAEVRAGTKKQGREEVYVALQYAASFQCLVEEWRVSEELQPKPKASGLSLTGSVRE